MLPIQNSTTQRQQASQTPSVASHESPAASLSKDESRLIDRLFSGSSQTGRRAVTTAPVSPSLEALANSIDIVSPARIRQLFSSQRTSQLLEVATAAQHLAKRLAR